MILPLLLVLAQQPCPEGPCVTGASDTDPTGLAQVKVSEDELQVGDEPVILGALTREHVKAVVAAQLPAYKRCYDLALTQDPRLVGKHVFQVVVDKTGTPTQVKLTQDTVGSATLAACVQAQSMALRFDPPQGGGIVIVSHPLFFEPGGGVLAGAPPLDEQVGMQSLADAIQGLEDAQPHGTSETALGTKQPPGRLSLGEPEVLGPLDPSLVVPVVKRSAAQLRYCYQRELSKKPGLGGDLSVRFVIQADGSVLEASVASSTLDHPTLERCVLGRFERLQFPDPRNGELVTVLYSMRFSPE
ncbi:MAG: AgmX/PglI C-terminal domain-containing protein [Alphaproteobacteria bacterium]|nr:AgmX/PglI C-terminal domain-containing protein [Alphaproteobacteria bacterium]